MISLNSNNGSFNFSNNSLANLLPDLDKAINLFNISSSLVLTSL